MEVEDNNDNNNNNEKEKEKKEREEEEIKMEECNSYGPSSARPSTHTKRKGFCSYAPPPLQRKTYQKAQPSSFNSGPMQLCAAGSRPRPAPKKGRAEGERKAEREKESLDTIIENEYTDEMSFLVDKISLTEDGGDDDEKTILFMPYIY